ncbi:MAG: PP2C family protein-serine/threonine phosphatase [Actinomycetes bacterium]
MTSARQDGYEGAAPGSGRSTPDSSDSALLETLVLEAPVAFAFYDTDLRYRRINRLLANINGLPMADHIGRRPSEVLPPELGQAIETRLREVLDTGRVVADDDFVARSSTTGDTRYYESRWFPAPGPDGDVIGIAVLVSDVTDRRRNENALRRSTERTGRLQRATAALSEALTVDDVRRVVAETARAVAGAEIAEVLLTDDHDVLAATGTGGDPRVVVLDLVVSGGRIGVLRLRLSEAPTPDDDAFLGALAGQCAIALERARLFERERATAVALQQSLLPDRLPDVPGVEMSARFRAGSAEAEVGGDWYDVFVLPDGRLVLVVGDVMGKGVEAAAGMGRLRSALRALAHANPLPEAVLQGLDRVFTATEGADQIATLVYLLVNPVARRAAVGGAGHLPLVLCRAGQEPELVDAGSGSTPLGWPEPRVQRTLELGPGDLLIGLTDGLVERRGADLDQGLAEVMAQVGQPERSLDALVERISGALLDHTVGRDDATLLAVRFTG